MTIRNKYSTRSRISEKKFRELLKLFTLDLSAVQISELTHLNRNTVNRYLQLLRIRIAEFCEIQSPIKGEIEVDESYFGAKRIKGNVIEVHLEKQLYLDYLNEKAKYIPKLSQIQVGRPSRALSEEE